MKKWIKPVSLVLALCVFLLAMPMVLAAPAVPTTQWKDHAAADFAGGTGTQEDPYLIETAEQFAKIAADVSNRIYHNGDFFRLENNLDLSAHRWNPIGQYNWLSDGSTVSNYFGGFLDGNNKTVTGLIVDEREDKYAAGLFGAVSNPSKTRTVGVKDLTISNADIRATDKEQNVSYAGILIAFAMTNDGCTIDVTNVNVSGKISYDYTNTADGGAPAGGMFGSANRLTVKNCNVTDIEITGTNNCGGFVGMDCGSTYENCTVKGSLNGMWAMGGFVGYASTAGSGKEDGSVFTRCFADVNVTASDWNAGGFAGLAEYARIENCVAAGNTESTVNGWEPRVGGFVGNVFESDVKNGHFTGSVSSASEDWEAGAFLGYYTSGTLTDCSYDKAKADGLKNIGAFDNAAPEFTGSINGEETNAVNKNICEDYYQGHDFGTELITDSDATCTVPGKKSHHCVRCDESDGQYVEFGGEGHVWEDHYTVDQAASCTEPGSESVHCANCDAVKDAREIPATGHDYQWVIDKEASKTEAGSKHEECTVCHDKKAPVEIPKETADNNTVAAALAVAALFALAAVFAASKKRTARIR